MLDHHPHLQATLANGMLAVTGGEMLTLFIWFALAAVLALGGLYAAIGVRKWSQREDRPENFTVQDLREMKARGEISEREFAAMRTALLGQFDLEADQPPDPASDGFPSDEPNSGEPRA